MLHALTLLREREPAWACGWRRRREPDRSILAEQRPLLRPLLLHGASLTVGVPTFSFPHSSVLFFVLRYEPCPVAVDADWCGLDRLGLGGWFLAEAAFR